MNWFNRRRNKAGGDVQDDSRRNLRNAHHHQPARSLKLNKVTEKSLGVSGRARVVTEWNLNTDTVAEAKRWSHHHAAVVNIWERLKARARVAVSVRAADQDENFCNLIFAPDVCLPKSLFFVFVCGVCPLFRSMVLETYVDDCSMVVTLVPETTKTDTDAKT